MVLQWSDRPGHGSLAQQVPYTRGPQPTAPQNQGPPPIRGCKTKAKERL